MRTGVEVGGTFTDLVAVDGDDIFLTKVPSTPSAPDRGVLEALSRSPGPLARIEDLVHGSTVATNAILERKGAKIAFVTTVGFRDILFLQRHDRLNIYDLAYAKPEPVVKRRDCFEVTERCDSQGRVIRPLDVEAEVERLLPQLKAGGYAAIAICLLSSYVNPTHERQLQAELMRRLPGIFVTGSADVSQEFREFERSSTTTLAAYVQPVIDAYLDRLSSAVAAQGFAGRFSVMQSNGGRLPSEGMRRNAIAALFSGPAAGVVGAVRQCGRSGVGNLIAFDMGGTSTDVCLVTDGRPGISADTTIGGLPVRTPVLDIETVGAGGGSLVWIDEGGMLRVGPQSSGAEPGPACYGRGGTAPTITDAHVIRGTIRPEAFLGGAMTIHVDKAHAAFEPIANELGMSIPAAAAAALRLAVANIVQAIQLVSTEKGRDPRDYALVPYGGAGPLLAAEVAEELGITTVVVTPNPGVLSAFGLIASDFSRIYARTQRFTVDDDTGEVIRAAFADLEQIARRDFATYGLGGELDFVLIAEMRFAGQAFEVPVELPLDALCRLDRHAVTAAFVAAHERIFFHAGLPNQKIEVVGFRLEVARPVDSLPKFRERPLGRPTAARATMSGEAGSFEAAVFSCPDLPTDETFAGPLLAEGFSSTLYVPERWSLTRDASENIILTREAT
ncbi:hydantoinase/oxoprolinase family protein [Acuticoccus mangrovi]|uniref:Hydantoinase/oxoprolinase family protein n=1 Tax=Acuticoccus mangrovi TaxID=2796142 RepID=A0A934MJ04_9HYPH|nr:hydantoinase/oxoprolinase family protein [Acuticoccus mangrovi]MBJ3778420.1 hydantoinase/oxoprolinase family protein [Acuticoccus mangrovi]